MESLKTDTASNVIYRVVPATIRDVHAIRRLEQVVFPLDAYTYLSLTSLLLWPGGANFKAVTGGDDLIGFVAGSPNWGTHVDWIITLGVHPAHQQRGLGRRLLSICEDNLTQPALRLTVQTSSPRSVLCSRRRLSPACAHLGRMRGSRFRS